MTEPKWHGWATPDQVRQMLQEMVDFLMENNEPCPSTIANARIAELKEIFGQELRKLNLHVQYVEQKWRD